MADIIVIGLIALCLVGILMYHRKQKKSGNTGCGCGCSNCTSTSCKTKTNR